MKYVDQVEHVKKLIRRSVADDINPDGALKYSQAALNAAHAIAVLQQIPEKPAS